MSLSFRNPNCSFVVTALINELDINVSSLTIRNKLENHPNYPSLLAISDCLTSWRIPHQTIKLDKDDIRFDDYSYPFIAHLRIKKGQFILVKEIKEGVVKFIDESKSIGSFTELEFLELWDGVILYAEKDEGSGEPKYRQALIKSWLNEARVPFLLLVLVSSILFQIADNQSWNYYALLGIKFLGIFVGVLLLIYSVNSNNSLVQNICGIGYKSNCNTILKSNASKVTAWLNWSEVGMFYFAGSFICLLIYPLSFNVIIWLNLFCLPYTIYSISYQIRVKSWCLLCCSVQVLLWLEALINLGSINSFKLPNVSPLAYIYYLVCFLFPIAIWSFVKPFIVKATYVNPLKEQLKKFKYNRPLFEQVLSTQSHYKVPDDLMPIVLGNSEAESIITMISNPYCIPCAEAHKVLDKWMKESNNFKLNIIFSTSNQKSDLRAKIAGHAISLNLSANKALVRGALDEWFRQSNGSIQDWMQKYPVDFNPLAHSIMEKQREWCESTDIEYTPTIIVNGYKLVYPYDLKDLKYLIG